MNIFIENRQARFSTEDVPGVSGFFNQILNHFSNKKSILLYEHFS
jgi:hypothetical protein